MGEDKEGEHGVLSRVDAGGCDEFGVMEIVLSRRKVENGETISVPFFRFVKRKAWA